jgi:hypothetical protein
MNFSWASLSMLVINVHNVLIVDCSRGVMVRVVIRLETKSSNLGVFALEYSHNRLVLRFVFDVSVGVKAEKT